MPIQNSINTNIGAFVALQNLNAVNTRLDTVQNRDRKSTRLNSSHTDISRMPSSA